MLILGLGHDVVDIAAFSEQLAEPGSRMRRLFSPRELRQSAMRARIKHDDESAHLAARWAGKEAVLKAWSEALADRPNPYTLDDFPWSGIEILDDSRGRPSVTLRDDVERTLRESLGIVVESASERGCVETSADADADAGEAPDGTHGQASAAPHDVRVQVRDTGSAEIARPAHMNPHGCGDGPRLVWHVSLSHDGPVASAVILLSFC